MTVNVPVADPDPSVQGRGEDATTWFTPSVLLVMVHGPAVSEGRP